MKTGSIRDFIVDKGLEEELLIFIPQCDKIDIEEWLKSEDLGY